MNIEEKLLEDIRKDECSLEDLEYSLARYLAYPSKLEIINNEEVFLEKRVRIEKIGNIEITIRPNDHNPPHFHVKIDNVVVSFRISDCTLLAGELEEQTKRKIRRWYLSAGQEHIMKIWDETRPQ